MCSSSAPAQPTSTSQTTIPEYAKPYAEKMLGKAEALTESKYEPFKGQRIATTTPGQQAARESVAGMQAPGQFGTATGLAGLAGLAGLSAGQFQPGTFDAPQVSAPSLTQFQMGPASRVRAPQLRDFAMETAQTVFRPDLQTFQMGPAQQVSSQGVTARDIEGAVTGFRPDLQAFQMAAPERIGATGVTARDIQAAQTGFSPQLERFQMTAPERFGTEAAQQYMSPYMQQVLDVQKREAIRDAQKSQLAQNLAAARQGTYGGARQLLATTERERALGTQLGDIQARGLEAAYGQAQQQFERDRAAQMAAQRENLQAALGVQQLGTQTGLQTALANLTNEQQARVQSEANRLQASGMSQDAALRAALANQQAGLTTAQQNLAAQLGVQQLGTQTGLQTALANLTNEQQARVQSEANRLQAQGMSQDAALRAALANQQAGLTVGQQNLAAQLGVQQLGTQTGLQTALANLSSEQQANVQNLAAQLQTQGLSADQALRSALANQQAGLTVGQQNLAALLGVQQLGAQQGLQAQQLNQQALMEAQRLAEQSRQFGGTLGLQGAQAATQAAQVLGGLGGAQQAAGLELAKAQEAFGGMTQQERQRALDQAYQDFITQQQYPYKQLGFMSDVLRGSANLAATGGKTVYEAPPSLLSQLGGAGLAAAGAYKLLG